MNENKLVRQTLYPMVATTLIAATCFTARADQLPLQAGIVHAEQLAPIKLTLLAGQKFDEKNAVKIDDKEWFEIPSWLAGTWRTIQRVQTTKYDSKTGDVESQEVILPQREREIIGYQLDRHQNVWTLRKPLQIIVHKSVIENPDAPKPPPTIPVTIYIFRQNHPISEDASRIVWKTLDTVLTVRDDNNKIETSELREAYRTFLKLDSDLLAMHTDEQTYDQSGLPKFRSKVAEIRKRDSGLKIVDEFQMTNILASFKNFLKSSGKSNISPER